MSRDATTQLPLGLWLLHDPTPGDAVAGTDFAVFLHSPQDLRVLIGWTGQHFERPMATGARPTSHRFLWVRIDGAQLGVLKVAAEHGAFHRVARRLWQEIMR